MDKQNLMPQAAQPVNRITTGQLPAQLAELSEEVLQLHGNDSNSVLSSHHFADDDNCACACGNCGLERSRCRCCGCQQCSYDGDDAE